MPTPSSVGDGLAAEVWGDMRTNGHPTHPPRPPEGGVRVGVGVGVRFEGLGLGLGCQRLLRFILRVASHATDVDPWEQAESGAAWRLSCDVSLGGVHSAHP